MTNCSEFSIQLHMLSRIHESMIDTGLHHVMRHYLHWLDMTDHILFRIAITVYHCLNCVPQIRQQKPTCDNVPPVKLSLRTADDVLVYPAQPFGTACRRIRETLHYLPPYFGAI